MRAAVARHAGRLPVRGHRNKLPLCTAPTPKSEAAVDDSKVAQPTGLMGRLKSWWNTEESEEWKATRKGLQEEMSKGYFDEMKESDKYAVGTSSASLMPAKTAKPFPSVQAKSLAGTDVNLPVAALNCVSLVSVVVRESAQVHVDSWRQPLIEKFGDAAYSHNEGSEVRYFALNILEGRVGAMVASMATANMKRRVPEEQHHAVLHYTGSVELKGLDLANRFVGYVFLLDHEGRVRWRGRGTSSAEQVAAACGRLITH